MEPGGQITLILRSNSFVLKKAGSHSKDDGLLISDLTNSVQKINILFGKISKGGFTMKMFQVWIGPRLGKIDEIVEAEDLEAAGQLARKRVLEAKEEGRSMLASVFCQETGTVISGFATENLRKEVKGYFVNIL